MIDPRGTAPDRQPANQMAAPNSPIDTFDVSITYSTIQDPNRSPQKPDRAIGDPYMHPASAIETFPSPPSGALLSPRLEKNFYRLADDRYIHDIRKKDLIVLHFTAGRTCESAYRTWQADPRRIATAYGVDPDGTVVEFFPPEAWAYHLGVRGTDVHDRRSIGIELANVGPLRLDAADAGRLNWWPSNWTEPYCRIDETDRFVAREYRGIQYFAAIPKPQLVATAQLVRTLCDRFRIPLHLTEAVRHGDFDPLQFAGHRGIASHANFREDKWDVGPAFDWSYLK